MMNMITAIFCSFREILNYHNIFLLDEVGMLMVLEITLEEVSSRIENKQKKS